MTAKTPLHESALVGWRGKVGDALAGPVSHRTKLTADQVRLVLGLVFFLSSVYYVVATVRRAVRDRSSSGGA
jgi:hypothetical protein